TGYGDNTTETNLVVENRFINHPMFKDVTFINGNEIKMVNEINSKALTYMNPESFIDATGVISSIANIKGEEQVSILEIEAGSSIAGTKINERYIQIGLNSSSYANITVDGLSVIKNACYYLMGESTQTSSIYKHSLISLYPNPMTEHVTIQIESDHPTKERLQITNLLGECIYVEQLLINSGSNIFTLNKDFMKEGIYIVQLGKYRTTLMVK
ncbi:MAG: T9SS type A sorting domain-containing protein, partial [Paludibacteraceae bacterium]|nr:T9SS type A sorting domain-containing protein [Paludibacteraceae bacterium]